MSCRNVKADTAQWGGLFHSLVFTCKCGRDKSRNRQEIHPLLLVSNAPSTLLHLSHWVTSSVDEVGVLLSQRQNVTETETLVVWSRMVRLAAEILWISGVSSSRALNPRYSGFSVPNQLTYICYNTVGQKGAFVDVSVVL